MRRERSPRLPSWVIGLVLLIVIAMGCYLAFTKELPWSDSYEIKAVFGSAQNIRPESPVRIAGVNVGKVVSVEHLESADDTQDGTQGQQAAVVTMELNEDALPLHSDATFKLRPRLFLEGNYFVDVQPGSPNAPETPENHTFPVNQTSYSVQLDQVLTTLQGDVRADLQTFLDQLGNALVKDGGAEGFRELYKTSAPAGKYTSQVNQAVLGTQPGDLTGLIDSIDRVVRGLGRNEGALQSLVTNFRVFSGSFAAEDVALGQAIDELPNTLQAAKPAFANLNAAFPPLRAFAREALPGVRSTPATLRAATPFINQVRALVSERELRGLVADLRPTIPELAKLAHRTVPFLDQARSLSSCFNEVVIPWANDTVDPVAPGNQYPHQPFGRVFEETAYGLSGIASESRSGDANGQYIRVEAGGGQNTVKIPDAIPSLTGGGLQDAVALLQFPLLGAMPRIDDSAKTPFEPQKPCERQEQPNLSAGLGQPPSSAGAQAATPDAPSLLSQFSPQKIREGAEAAGLPAAAAKQLATLSDAGGDN